MKSSVAIVLIVCGTILIAVPHIHNTIVMWWVADTMVAMDKTVRLTGDIPKHADIVCMLGGITMIIVGAIAGLRSGKPEQLQNKAVETSP